MHICTHPLCFLVLQVCKIYVYSTHDIICIAHLRKLLIYSTHDIICIAHLRKLLATPFWEVKNDFKAIPLGPFFPSPREAGEVMASGGHLGTKFTPLGPLWHSKLTSCWHWGSQKRPERVPIGTLFSITSRGCRGDDFRGAIWAPNWPPLGPLWHQINPFFCFVSGR